MQKPLSFSPIKLALSRRLGREAEEATTLQSEHRLVEAVLEQIEVFADALPQLPPRTTLELIVINLRDGVPAHCRHEERALGELQGDAVTRALALLTAEHEANDAIAAELAEAIEDCLANDAVVRPEALGQLARQYFMLMRRHMAWEEYLVESLLEPEEDAGT